MDKLGGIILKTEKDRKLVTEYLENNSKIKFNDKLKKIKKTLTKKGEIKC
jgi:hypothetical protein